MDTIAQDTLNNGSSTSNAPTESLSNMGQIEKQCSDCSIASYASISGITRGEVRAIAEKITQQYQDHYFDVAVDDISNKVDNRPSVQ